MTINRIPGGAQVNYSNGPLYVTLAHADEDWSPASNSFSATKVGASYAFGDTKLVGTYERNDDKGSDGKYNSYSLGVAQSFGANTVKLQYAKEDENDSSLWAVGLDHALSKRTQLFALYADGDDIVNAYEGDNGKLLDSGIEVGISHSF